MTYPRTYPLAEVLLTQLMRNVPPLSSQEAMRSRTGLVRSGVVKPSGAQALVSAKLEQFADAALLRVDPNGEMSWEICFNDAVLGAVRCCVGIEGGQIFAHFLSDDAATVRLLEAEQGRLRVMLTDQGLKTGEVKVIYVPPEKSL